VGLFDRLFGLGHIRAEMDILKNMMEVMSKLKGQIYSSNLKDVSFSPEKVQELLGPENMKRLSERMGVSPEQAAAKLSSLLPFFVEQVQLGKKIDLGFLRELMTKISGE